MSYPQRVTLPAPPPESRYWDYTEGLETPEQFEAFAHYRDLGPGVRTLARVHRDTGQPYGALCAWARDCLWYERATSYDKHRIEERTRLREQAEAEADRAWADQRAELLADMRRTIDLGMGQLLHRLRTRRAEMRPNEIARLIAEYLRYGNLAAGDATEKVDVGGAIDYTGLSDEELAVLDRVLPRKGQEE